MNKQRTVSIAAGFIVGAAWTPLAVAQSAPPNLTEEQAHSIAVDTYIYLSAGHDGHHTQDVHKH
jgi:hypothetical protein